MRQEVSYLLPPFRGATEGGGSGRETTARCNDSHFRKIEREDTAKRGREREKFREKERERECDRETLIERG
jgi:hypothetical protein